VPGSKFKWKPYTKSGNLTVFPIVTEHLVKQGVAQKYVPITQLVSPQAQMLMDLSEKLTPAYSVNTGAGVMKIPSLETTLTPVKKTMGKVGTQKSPYVGKRATNPAITQAKTIIQKTSGINVDKLMTSIRSMR
jgi:hypothetical protein